MSARRSFGGASGLRALVVALLAVTMVVFGACGDDGGSGTPDSGSGRPDGSLSFGDTGRVDTGAPDAGRVDVPAPACLNDGDCPREKPNCQAGVCVECVSPLQCGGQPCVDGVCQGTEPDTCEPNSRFCSGDTLLICGPDGTVADRVSCPGACHEGRCTTCRPLERSCEGDDVVLCNGDGTGFQVLETCQSDGGCYEGECMACYPGVRRCVDAVAQTCRTDGGGWDVTEDCGASGLECMQGACVNPCIIDPKTQTNAGCDFWALDMDNAFYEAEDGSVYDAQGAQFAVIVSNTDEYGIARVTVTLPDGSEQQQDVQPRSLGTFRLPSSYGLDGSGVSDWAFRVRSSRPVTVYQFNPLSNEDVFSNDASVLLPTPSLGTDYYVVSQPEGAPYRGFFSVVAVEPGTTDVYITPTVATLEGTGVPAMSPGVPQTIRMQQGQVLNVESNSPASFFGPGGDLSGTRVRATQPVVVFSGHEAAVTGTKCCADHLEQQLPPVSRWGTRYVASHSMTRGAESDHYLLLAAESGTTVTFQPAVDGAPTTLTPGVPARFTSKADFVVEADKPVLLVQFLASSQEILGEGDDSGSCSVDADCPTGYTCEFGGLGMSCMPPSCSSDNDCPGGHTCVPYPEYFTSYCEPIGDPAMIVAVPVQQYRDKFVFLTPDSYVQDFVNIVAPEGATVTLDGRALVPGDFVSVAGSEFVVHRTEVADGVHVVESTAPVGIVVYGYDKDVSYGYPGGLGLEELNPVGATAP